MRVAPALGALAAATFAGGCSGHPLTPEPARLVPWQVEAEGGAPLVMGIYDTQEKAHCRFAPDETGQLRCLPWGEVDLGGVGAFSDPACQKPVYETPDPAQTGLMVGRSLALPLPAAGCAPARFAVGILRARGADEPLFAGTPCARLDAGAVTGANLTVDEFEAPDRWATGAELDGPLLFGRLRLRRIGNGGDASFDDHFVDTRWSAPCALTGAADTAKCWPPSLPDLTYDFEDDQCHGTPVWQVGACEKPAFIGQSGPALHAIGAEWRGAVFLGTKGCFPVTPTASSGAFFEEGGLLGDDAVVTVDWVTDAGGRLQRRGLRGAGGELVPISAELANASGVAPFRDTVAELDCNPLWTPDGLVRCVPTNVLFDSLSLGLFADAACQTPAYFCPRFPAGCRGLPMISFAADANGIRHASSVNVAESAAGAFMRGDAGCVATTSFDPSMLFIAGPVLVPWDQFPALEERNGRPSGAP